MIERRRERALFDRDNQDEDEEAYLDVSYRVVVCLKEKVNHITWYQRQHYVVNAIMVPGYQKRQPHHVVNRKHGDF